MADIIALTPSTSQLVEDRVQRAIRQGGVVAIPTDTFYGLGVDPFNESAVDRLLRLKGRPDGKPILLLIGSLEQLPLVTKGVSTAARILIEAFWPGPLTILFPAIPSLPRNLVSATGLVGVRFGAFEPLNTLLCPVGPLTGTSANRAGQPPAQTPLVVTQEFGGAIDLVVDAGMTAGGAASTVIDAQFPLRVIREGAVTRQKIQDVLEKHGIALG